MSKKDFPIRKLGSKSLHTALKKYFGYEEFRECQEEALGAMLRGENLFFTGRTSLGKSLVYQLGAAMLDGVTIVVCPLIALMHDQVKNFNERPGVKKAGICAAYANSTLKRNEVVEQFQLVSSGKAKLLYISPENMNTSGFCEYVEQCGIRVSRIIVDEAHCVSEWGHDFRPDYLAIPRIRKRLGNPPLLALTATAPVSIRDDVLNCLEIPDCLQLETEMDRPNLVIRTEEFWNADDKWAELLKRIRPHSKKKEKTIIYCRKISTVENLAKLLEKVRGVSSEIYHGKMEAEKRREVETKFRDGITPILIATKAFGMGIDVEDVRHVYHYEVPDSLESYWQEIGRAGRDGKRSYCTLFFQGRDIDQLKHFVRSSNPSLSFIKKVWGSLTRVLKPNEWKAQVPSRFLKVEKFCKEYSGKGEDPFLSTVVQAAISALCEYRIIEITGTRCKFLIKPQDLKDEDFPITEITVANKRDAALQRLKIMIYYAMHAGSNPRRLITGHFLHNNLVNLVEDMNIDSWYKVPAEVRLATCQALATGDFQLSQLSTHLRGVLPSKKTPAKKGKKKASKAKTAGAEQKAPKPGFAALAKLSPRDLRIDLRQLGSLGYLRLHKVGSRTFASLAETGLELLKEEGIELSAATSFSELKKAMHSPANLELLQEALSGWRAINSGRKTANAWWRVIDEFLSHDNTVSILGERHSGLVLVAAFVHKKAILLRTKKAFSRADENVGTGVTRTDAKLFLNYLFDGCIET